MNFWLVENIKMQNISTTKILWKISKKDSFLVIHVIRFADVIYRISSNKLPWCLLNFETVRCGAY